MKDKMYVYDENGVLKMLKYEANTNIVGTSIFNGDVFDSIYKIFNTKPMIGVSNSYGFPVVSFDDCDIIFDKNIIKNQTNKEFLFVVFNILGPKNKEKFEKTDEKNNTILDIMKNMVSNNVVSNKFYENIKLPVTTTLALATLVGFTNVKKDFEQGKKGSEVTYETVISNDINFSTSPDEGLENLLDPEAIYIPEDEFIDQTAIDNIISKDNRKVDLLDQNEAFDIGGQVTTEVDEMLRNYINTKEGILIFKYSVMYGIDPYLMLALAMNESTLDHENTLPGASRYNNYAVGLFQHETPIGEKIVAYNYEEHGYEADYITMDNAVNIETNIKLAAMKMQNCIRENDSNVLLALQAYNGGQGFVNIVSSKFRSELRIEASLVSSTVSILDYTKEFEVLSTNTREYMSELPEDVKERNPNTFNEMKDKETFATGDYISKVMSYYIGTRGVFKSLNENGEEIVRIYSYEDENYADYSLINEELDASRGR